MTPFGITSPADALPKSGTNEPVLLGRYRTRLGADRGVFVQRVAGTICLTDAPARGCGRCYLIEDGLHLMDELVGIVEHYCAQARRCGEIPARLRWRGGSFS